MLTLSYTVVALGHEMRKVKFCVVVSYLHRSEDESYDRKQINIKHYVNGKNLLLVSMK